LKKSWLETEVVAQHKGNHIERASRVSRNFVQSGFSPFLAGENLGSPTHATNAIAFGGVNQDQYNQKHCGNDLAALQK
jgi:hypothetical protein